MLRIAIIGLGDIAPAHIEAIAAYSDAALVAGCDIDTSRRTLLPQGAAFYTDIVTLLTVERPDVVHICLPHHLHFSCAKLVAEAGCNILIEKPVAANLEQAKAVAMLENKYGIHICVCLQNRCNETSRMLLEYLKSGNYGRVIGVRGIMTWYRESEYYAARRWRGQKDLAGGGCMITQAIHTLDLLQLFARSHASSVRGCVGRIMGYDTDVEDSAIARITFENGVEGLFLATLGNFEDTDVEFDVVCERARFRIREKELWIQDTNGKRMLTRDDVRGFAGKACYGGSHGRLVQNFYDALCGKPTDYPHPNDGIAVQKLIAAIEASSVSGEPVDRKM